MELLNWATANTDTINTVIIGLLSTACVFGAWFAIANKGEF